MFFIVSVGSIGLRCGYWESIVRPARTYRTWWHWFGSRLARLLSLTFYLWS